MIHGRECDVSGVSVLVRMKQIFCLCAALAKQTLEEKSGQASLVIFVSGNRTLLRTRGRLSEVLRFLMMKRESTCCHVLASLI